MDVFERRAIIEERVTDHGEVQFADLAREFGVSEMTIRRDIEVLQSAGIVRRVSGGAIALLVLAMLVAVIVALWVSRADTALVDWVVDYWNRFALWVQGWVT